MKEEVYPLNKLHFIKLKNFCREVIKEVKIEPILYGSFMIFYYTKDRNMKVNDIDLYVKERDFDKLIRAFKNKGIKFNSDNVEKWHTMEASKDNLKVELDSIEFWNKNKIKTTDIDFNGIKTKALSLKSLKEIYKKASETSEDNPEGNKKKYELLRRID